MRPGRKRTPLLGPALAALGMLAAACSGGTAHPGVAHLAGSPAAATSTTLSQNQADQDFVDFARCLRVHGVSEPDPSHRPGHSGLTVEIPPAGPSTNAALAACHHYIEPIVQLKQAHARQQLASWLPALTRYAQCMRSHDIPMLDPDASGSLDLGNVPGITGDFGRDSPQFRTADAACRHLLPAAVHDDGTGP